jgi:hypothetical protein
VENKFPFHFQRGQNWDERKEIKWLRQHSNYLALDTSFFGWDIWRMIGMYLSGLVLTIIVPFSLALLIAYVIRLLAISVTAPVHLARTLFVGSLVVFSGMVIARGWAALYNLEMTGRRWREFLQAGLAVVAALLAAVGGPILLAVYLPEVKSEVYKVLNGVSLASVIGLAAGLLQSKSERLQGWLKLIFRIAWIALLPVLFAQLLRFLWATHAFDIKLLGGLPVPVLAAFVLLVASLFINTNRISLHHFYRDRLSEAYVIKRVRKPNGTDETLVSNETLTLAGLQAHPNGAPYHLINATLNVPDTRDRYLRGRGADFFVFSKLYCGAESTGHRRTDKYDKGETRLATALAISGAAASPQMGTSTSPIATFFMTLLNVRLNRWMPNPNPRCAPLFEFWPYYFVKELLGKTKETDWLLNLSDGGHHENLGVYPLIKRGCRYIISADTTADPTLAMEDLANLQRKVRIDLGVDIDMDLSGLRQNPQSKNTPQHYAVGKIHYPDDKVGVLLYIKSSLTGREPEDLLAYRRQNPDFPHQTTADQFFDEAQFESYRKLGDLIGRQVFSQEALAKLTKRPLEPGFEQEAFCTIQERYEASCQGREKD